ncbi:hypothetical protein [Serratia fonticola]|uniref:hypothetical protein n=1 Tax=Serratia fonticola TaxID=47917 RepID=UPI001ED907E6|nr:hypothetical protein [Serratia fonticola]
MKSQNGPTMPERHKLLVAGAGIAATSLIPHVTAAGKSSQVDSFRQNSQRPAAAGKRKLGKLEVSAVGMGVQNISRKYDTSVPRRHEMVNVIRRAFDEGMQFLTGWIDENTRFAAGDFRATETRFSPDNLPHNLQLVELLKS